MENARVTLFSNRILSDGVGDLLELMHEEVMLHNQSSLVESFLRENLDTDRSALLSINDKEFLRSLISQSLLTEGELKALKDVKHNVFEKTNDYETKKAERSKSLTLSYLRNAIYGYSEVPIDLDQFAAINFYLKIAKSSDTMTQASTTFFNNRSFEYVRRIFVGVGFGKVLNGPPTGVPYDDDVEFYNSQFKIIEDVINYKNDYDYTPMGLVFSQLDRLVNTPGYSDQNVDLIIAKEKKLIIQRALFNVVNYYLGKNYMAYHEFKNSELDPSDMLIKRTKNKIGEVYVTDSLVCHMYLYRKKLYYVIAPEDFEFDKMVESKELVELSQRVKHARHTPFEQCYLNAQSLDSDKGIHSSWMKDGHKDWSFRGRLEDHMVSKIIDELDRIDYDYDNNVNTIGTIIYGRKF